MAKITMNKREIVFTGVLTIHIIGDLQKKLDKYFNNSFKDITLHFEKVINIDTACLQLILSFLKATKKRQPVRIGSISHGMLKILKLSGLEECIKS